MRINIIINDETIMEDIQLCLDGLEEDKEVNFPDSKTREEFEKECFEEIAEDYENNSAWNGSSYLPTWDIIQDIVQDAVIREGYNKTSH